MQILETLFGPNVRNLSHSMTRASMRQSVLNNNLANVNVPNYRRRDVDFSTVLEGETSKPGAKLKSIQQKLGMHGVTTERAKVRVDGNSVDLEKEVTAISETELRYDMLTEMTGRFFSGLKNVIREGK
ncbi:MAG: flagellar basal body rod protein FlgB [Fimbriimonadaceae bacterium]|nr:flagellar basal body rod protein FlgB [Fimbriimonadaceae bacterium]